MASPSPAKSLKVWLIVILGIAAVCVVAMVLLYGQRQTGGMVQITQNGTVVGTYPLDQDTTLRVDSDNGGYNLVVIENHTVRVAEASCPDQVCVRHGATDQTADPIACLPNGLVVEVNVKKLTTMAMLTAISMIVFLIEAQIPLPIAIPGVKLGVANVITLFAIWTLGRREAGVILLIRIVLGNLIVGSVMAMLYSLAGGLLCWVIMCLMKPITSRKHIWVMSIFGAMGHNVGQLAVAIFVSGTVSIAIYAPVLFLAGIVTGFFTGQCAQAVLNHMDKLRKSS